MTASACMDPNKVEAFVRKVSETIFKVYGANDFKSNRLTKVERHALGLFKCQRWYNRRWRLLARMEKKIQRLAWNQRKYLFTRVGKGGLAVEIPFEDFAADVNTACLVAYLSARMSMRSAFTNTSQVRAYDNVSEMLYNRAVQKGTIRYDVVAYLMADEKVLRRLSDEQKGQMLGRWWALLTDMADMLHEYYRTAKFNRANMIVTKGNDSSTWNQVAGGRIRLGRTGSPWSTRWGSTRCSMWSALARSCASWRQTLPTGTAQAGVPFTRTPACGRTCRPRGKSSAGARSALVPSSNECVMLIASAGSSG